MRFAIHGKGFGVSSANQQTKLTDRQMEDEEFPENLTETRFDSHFVTKTLIKLDTGNGNEQMALIQ
eukprot:6297946-Amphidinium_carterae.1